MEELVEFFKTIPEGFLVPTNFSNEKDDFFFLLKESEEIYKLLSKENITIGIELPEITIQYKEQDIEILYVIFILNKEHIYSIPFVLNYEDVFISLIRFFGSEEYNIFLGDKLSIGLAGPFSKPIFPSREEWLSLNEIDEESYLELHFLLTTFFSNSLLLEIAEAQKEGSFNEIINFDEIFKN